ncbi:UDP-GlcNAc:undecaprenyl-phosphate GlcNAc-1-phosphate transferase [Catenulispora sp. GAS73]
MSGVPVVGDLVRPGVVVRALSGAPGDRLERLSTGVNRLSAAITALELRARQAPSGARRSAIRPRAAGSVERVAAAGVFGGAGRVAGVGGVVAAGAVGGGVARGAYRLLNARPPGGRERWVRKNNRGREVTLLEGPAVALGIAAAALLVPGLSASVRLAGCGAALGAGAVGLYDDLNERGAAKGFRGHLSALAHGEVTTGAVKILGIGATGLAAGAVIRRDPLDRVLAGLVVAGAANVVNLFDLRPGRATKAAVIGAGGGLLREVLTSKSSSGLFTAAALGAAAALLPEDLGEQAMLGDCGANALGAALGVAAAARASRPGLVALATGLVALTAASEKVSFTKVIAATPPLRALDEWGRIPKRNETADG